MTDIRRREFLTWAAKRVGITIAAWELTALESLLDADDDIVSFPFVVNHGLNQFVARKNGKTMLGARITEERMRRADYEI